MDNKIDLKELSSDELIKMGADIIGILSGRGVNFFVRVFKDYADINKNIKLINELFNSSMAGEKDKKEKEE